MPTSDHKVVHHLPTTAHPVRCPWKTAGAEHPTKRSSRPFSSHHIEHSDAGTVVRDHTEMRHIFDHLRQRKRCRGSMNLSPGPQIAISLLHGLPNARYALRVSESARRLCTRVEVLSADGSGTESTTNFGLLSSLLLLLRVANLLKDAQCPRTHHRFATDETP